MSTAPFPEPGSTDDLRGLLLDYLDYYRAIITDKLDGLGPDQLVSTNVPSGWTPAGLVNHLVHAERRWLVWGFLAEPVDDPWRDMAPSGGWVTLETRYDELERALLDAGRRTRAIVEEHDLTETAGVGGRFPDHESAPQLQWILLHLDIAREVLDGHGGAVTDP